MRGYTCRHTDSWEGFKKYAVEMDSGAVLYIPSFIKIGSGIKKLSGDTETHKCHGDLISLLYFFFQNKESTLKIGCKYAVCFNRSLWDPIACPCEHGDEDSGYIKLQ
jgi:hypothetical protein